MFRSHNFNLKSISNLWSLRLGAFLPKNPVSLFIFHATLSEKTFPRSDKLLYCFSSPPFPLLQEILLPTLSPSCRCSPFSFQYGPGPHCAVQELDVLSRLQEHGCSTHQSSLLKTSSPILSPYHVFWLQWGLFLTYVSSLFNKKCNKSWTYKNVLAP